MDCAPGSECRQGRRTWARPAKCCVDSPESVYAASRPTWTDIRTPHQWPGQSLSSSRLSSHGIMRTRGTLFTRLGTEHIT